jgi:hypothetical protein
VDDAARRLAQNEAMFRQANEEVEGAAARMGASLGDTFGFFCECSNPTCTRMVEMTLAEYEALRAGATNFAVRPGHVESGVERVVESHPTYWIVRKSDAAAAEAKRLDPRS